MILSALAPAKLNLFLHVVGKRADGYHNLQSLMVPLGTGDILHAAPSDDITLSLTDTPESAVLDAEEDNLALRAVRLLQAALEEEQGLHLTLEKKLPVASGMGGGSSDAATAMRLALAVWGREVDEVALASLALSLGADVPFFLEGTAVYAEGIGEMLKPVDLPSLPVVLVNPGVAVPTRTIFEMGVNPISFPRPLPEQFGDTEALLQFLSGLGNDLEKNACSIAPEIADVLEAIGEMPNVRLSRMTGSGATCFGLFTREDEAEEAAEILGRRFPDYWIRATQFA